MLTATELHNELSQCYGSMKYHRHLLGMQYTEGINILAIQGKCHWLIDAISSYQFEVPFICDRDLKEFQVWVLTVKDNAGTLCCYRDSPSVCDPIVTQQIPYTDFGLPEIKIYVENNVILLPSEH